MKTMIQFLAVALISGSAMALPANHPSSALNKVDTSANQASMEYKEMNSNDLDKLQPAAGTAVIEEVTNTPSLLEKKIDYMKR